MREVFKLDLTQLNLRSAITGTIALGITIVFLGIFGTVAMAAGLAALFVITAGPSDTKRPDLASFFLVIGGALLTFVVSISAGSVIAATIVITLVTLLATLLALWGKRYGTMGVFGVLWAVMVLVLGTTPDAAVGMALAFALGGGVAMLALWIASLIPGKDLPGDDSSADEQSDSPAPRGPATTVIVKFEKKAPTQSISKDATDATRDAQRRVLSELDFSDRQSFEDATKGFIAPLPNDGVIKNAKGDVIWSLPDFDFLAGDATAPDTVNPSLWRQAQIMYANAGLFKVTDGIYQICGSDISNVTFIEGDTGVIVMDPLMSEEVAKAALDLYHEHRPNKPVVAVILTHSHIDHYGGVLGVTSTADIESGQVKLYAPVGFSDAALNEGVIGGNREARLSAYQYSMLVERGPRGNMTSGLGLDTSKGNTTFAIPTELITRTGQTETIDGLEFEFLLAPDTEAPAEMFFYIPKYKALTVAEDATFTMHNVYSLRGTTVRSSYNWAKYLREAREKWGAVAEVLYAPHHWPMWGADRIDEHLKRHSAAYKFINDQAVRRANQGYDTVEAGEMVELPGSLAQDFSLRGYYGTMNHDVKSAYVKHFGWFDGNAATLHPLPRVPAGTRYVEYMGGADAIMAKAQRDFANGDYRWVAEVLNHLVYADPSNTDAKNLLADTLEQLAYQCEAGTWRGLYLSAAKDLREGVKELAVVDFSSPSTVAAMPFHLYLDGLSTRLDPAKASGVVMGINLEFTDTKTKWYLVLEYGVLQYYENKQESDADASLSMTVADFSSIAEGQTKLDDDIKSGKIALTGSQAKFDQFLSVFDSFDAWYNVVTPVVAK